MTAPILEWYDGDDLIVAPEDLAEATPGTASTLSNFDLWNDKDGDGADTAYNRALQIAVRTPLTPEEISLGTPARPFVSVGNEPTNDYWFEARINAGLGDLTLTTGPWTPLGTGRWLRLPAIASECGISIDLRVSTPGGPQSQSVEWALSVIEITSVPLPIGLHESFGPGVNLGMGDSEITQLLKVSANVLENGGGADNQVQMPDVAWIAAGVPYVVVEHLLTFTNTDSAAAALAAGESYYGLVYASSSGTIAIEKGAKTSTPGPDDKPSPPSDGLAIAYVLREADADGGDIETADIENTYVVGAAHFSSVGLNGTLGPYRAVSDNRLHETTTSSAVTLTASETNRIWLLPDGSLEVSITAAVPESRALLLWEAVTDGSGVTSSTDRRCFFAFGYRLQRLDFRFDTTLVAAQKQRLAYANNRTGYILPLGGVSMYLLTSGATSGATTVDINLRAPGGAFTTVFTSQGTEDRRPSIASSAVTLSDTDALPEVLAVPAYSLLEVEIDGTPGSAVPDWMNVVILLACP